MKNSFLAVLLATFLFSCISNGKTEHSSHDTSSKNQKIKPEEVGLIPQIKPVFTAIDKNVSLHIKDIFDHYLFVKTALVNGNPSEAITGANSLLAVLKNFDRSLIPAEQKISYDQHIANARNAVKGIAGAGDIKKQREFFLELSNNAYALAKSFGAERTIYHEYCPMAFDNKGAMWLSDSKEIRNPYYGEEMLECGTMKEVIEK
jgi:hypothetical protein